MWQPTQYYHTKMQFARMELEQKMQIGIGGKKKNRKTDSGPIMEKMRMLEITDGSEDESELFAGTESSENLQERFGNQRMTEELPDHIETEPGTESDSAETVESEKFKKKKKRTKKRKTEVQERETGESGDSVSEQKIQEQVAAESENGYLDKAWVSSEQLQERVLWSEILGEPVSVRRRKKRMERLYGNQGNAYRR